MTPSKAQIDVGCAKARKALDDYSSFYSRMVSDDVIRNLVTEIATAVINIPNQEKAK